GHGLGRRVSGPGPAPRLGAKATGVDPRLKGKDAMAGSSSQPLGGRVASGTDAVSAVEGGSRLSVAQAYTRFMILFFFVVGTMCIIRPITDQRDGSLIMWPEAGKVLGLCLVNWFHFVLHVFLGIWAIIALRKTSWCRAFGWGVFLSCAPLVIIGLLTPDGVWLVPAHWSTDVVNDQITLVTTPGWYGFIPANIPDDIINTIVGLSGLIIALHPIALRPWGYWRQKAAA